MRFPALIVSLALCLAASAQTRIYPSAAKPPRRLLVLDMRNSNDYEERCLVASAQGLYNSRPGATDLIYVEWTPEDAFWLNWLTPAYVPETRNLGGITELMRLTPRNAVLYNEHPSHLPDIATTYAGCTRLLMAGSPEIVRRYGLSVKADLSDRFPTNAEAYQWLWAKFRSQISRKTASFTVPYRTPTHNPSQLRDYLVANKVLTFWISGDLDQLTIGANRKAEEGALSKILSGGYPMNIPVLGYPWSGDGYGPGEGDGVTYLSRLGKFLIPTDNFGNLSVWTSFDVSHKVLPAGPGPITPEAGQTYAALVMSDGDNLCTYLNYWPSYWEGLKDRSAPVGWTMGPTLRELAPPVYDYAVSHLPYGHTVGSGVSGVGYMAVDQFGKGLPNPDRALDAFVGLTEAKCSAVNEKWLWIMRYGYPYSPELTRYMDGLKSIRTLMGGYGRTTKNLAASIERHGGATIFHCTLEGDNADRVIASMDEMLADPQHPKYFQIFLMNWSYRAEDLDRLEKYCASKGVKLVTPEQLGGLAGR